ncbi:hypothetical protein V8E53_008681 [Lactarius tabidus]
MRNTLYTTTGALPLEHECYTRAILVNRHLTSSDWHFLRLPAVRPLCQETTSVVDSSGFANTLHSFFNARLATALPSLGQHPQKKYPQHSTVIATLSTSTLNGKLSTPRLKCKCDVKCHIGIGLSALRHTQRDNLSENVPREQKNAPVNIVSRIREGGGIRASKSEYNSSFYTGRSPRRERTLSGFQLDASTTNFISPECIAFNEESVLYGCWRLFGLESSSSWGTPAFQHLTIISKWRCQMCNWVATSP